MFLSIISSTGFLFTRKRHHKASEWYIPKYFFVNSAVVYKHFEVHLLQKLQTAKVQNFPRVALIIEQQWRDEGHKMLLTIDVNDKKYAHAQSHLVYFLSF